MTVNKDLEYYKNHPGELINKEVMVYDENHYIKVLSISKDGTIFYSKTFRGYNKESYRQYPVNSIRVIADQ